MKSRADIKNYILDIEQRFSVQEWKLNDIHIWPYVRIRLYFSLLNQVESCQVNAERQPIVTTTSTSNILFRKTATLFNLLYAMIKYRMWLNSLKKRDFLFAGNDAHRVFFNNSRYNRFFDTLIDILGIANRTAFLEYGSLKRNNLANRQCHIDFGTGFDLHKKYWDFKRKLGVAKFFKFTGKESYRDFIEYLKADELTKVFGVSCEQPEVKFRFVTIYCDLFRKTLQKVKPRTITTLCYYTEEMMTLHAVANQLGIETIEMQHGPITDLHLAYSNWSNIPETGYDMLPRKFWCWDTDSCKAINQWTQYNTLYSSFPGGNTWVNFWKNRDDKSMHSNFILYALQPSPITLEQLFTDQIVDTIKSSKYIWYLRLHPRQLQQKQEVVNFAATNGFLDKINIDDATNAPLPLLLKNCILNVTHFSGTAIEAADFNKFTVLLNKLGEQAFESIIKRELAVYLNPYSPSFRIDFERIIEVNLMPTRQAPASVNNPELVKEIFR